MSNSLFDITMVELPANLPVLPFPERSYSRKQN